MRHFLVLFDQVLLKRADFLVVQVLVVLVDFHHCWWTLHKIHCEILKVLEQRVVCVYSDCFSILDQKDVPGHQNLNIGSDSFLVDFV